MMSRYLLFASWIVLVQSQSRSEEVASRELVAAWKATGITQMSCSFEYSIRSTQGTSPFGDVDAIEKEERGKFWRDSEKGMKLQMPESELNLLGDTGLSVTPDTTRDMEGLNRVIVEPGETATIRSLSIVVKILHWIDPLATKHYSKVAALKDGKFEIQNDPEYGEVVRVRIDGSSSRAEQMEYVYTFCKGTQWRLVQVARNWNGQAIERTIYEYEPIAGLPRLKSVKSTTLNPQSAVIEQEELLTILDSEFDCSIEDLQLEIPNYSLVTDRTASDSQHIVRKDGSIRKFSEAERALAKSWKEIHDSEEDELFNKQSFNWGRVLVLPAGGILLAAAAVIAFRHRFTHD